MAQNQGDPGAVVNILEKINPNALIIGFARRFATYKRAHLLFTDLDRLAKIVNNEKYPVQFIFSGKAHPADGAGQGLIKRIIEISKMPQFLGKIIFLEDYNMIVAKRLVSGVDIWLNTPTRPLEASGTSGEKAEMNGVLNFSVLDGWWYEGYKFDEPLQAGHLLRSAHLQIRVSRTVLMLRLSILCLRMRSYPFILIRIIRDIALNGLIESNVRLHTSHLTSQ